METIGKQKIWSFLDRSQECKVTTNTRVREGGGHKVSSFLELARKIAELQFLNRDHVLLFRGQGGDHRNVKGNTSVKPTLFRPGGKGNPDRATLEKRFEILARAERALVGRYQSAGFRGLDRIKRHHVLRWSILQHYEVCATPLLDVTHSIRIAASFASLSVKDFGQGPRLCLCARRAEFERRDHRERGSGSADRPPLERLPAAGGAPAHPGRISARAIS